MRIIAVVNQKGGVGKTTTSVNLGAGLALRGRRVLLLDMDPQGNLTDHLLSEPPPGTVRPSVYDVLVEGLPVAQAVTPTATPGLFVVPSHEDMAGCELDLASVIGREVLLRDALAELPADAWDFVFLDCPPSLGLLSLNALAAANEVFIALQTEFFAMRGLSALDRTIELVRRRINPQLVLGGIVPTLVDPTRLSREIMDEVRGHYGERVFDTRIRTNVRLAEAPSYGKHIFEYAPDCAGAADYAALAAEVDAGARAVPEAAPAAVVAAPVVAAPRAPAAPAVATPTAVAPAAPPPAKAAPKRGIAAAIAQAAAAVTKKLGTRNEGPTQGPAADAPAADAPPAADDAFAPEPPAGLAPAAEDRSGAAPAAEPAAAPSATATIDEPAVADPAALEAADGDAHADATPNGRSVAATAVVAQALAAGAAAVEPTGSADAAEPAEPAPPSEAVAMPPTAPQEAVEVAPVPDAAVPDAAVPDAAVPDAAVPDAAIPDAGTDDAASAIAAIAAVVERPAAIVEPPAEIVEPARSAPLVAEPTALVTPAAEADVPPPAPAPEPVAAPRRPIPALPVLKAGRPFALGRMPLRPLAPSRAIDRPAP